MQKCLQKLHFETVHQFLKTLSLSEKKGDIVIVNAKRNESERAKKKREKSVQFFFLMCTKYSAKAASNLSLSLYDV